MYEVKFTNISNHYSLKGYTSYLRSLCMCYIIMWTFSCLWAPMYGHVHGEVIDQHSVFSSIALLDFEIQSLNCLFTHCVWLTGQCTSESLLSPSPQFWRLQVWITTPSFSYGVEIQGQTHACMPGTLMTEPFPLFLIFSLGFFFFSSFPRRQTMSI